MWFTSIERLLDPTQVSEAGRLLSAAPMINGRLTAGRAAAAVKNNLQADRQVWDTSALDQLVVGALTGNAKVNSVALPARIGPRRTMPAMTPGWASDPTPTIPT